MIKFDFNTYTKKFIEEKEYNKLIEKKDYYTELLTKDNMTGWMRDIDNKLIEDIKNTGAYIKKNW